MSPFLDRPLRSIAEVERERERLARQREDIIIARFLAEAAIQRAATRPVPAS